MIIFYHIEIKHELKASNETLEDVDKKYSLSGKLITDTINYLGDVLAANSKVFCYLACFVMAMLFFLYSISSH